jgi:hypothetical protein
MDTNIFYPEPNTLAFSDSLFAQTIMTSPILFLTGNPLLAENIYIYSTFPLSALTMFLLSFYLTNHIWASVLTGIMYAFSYPRISQIGHLPALSSQWLPLFFLYLIRWIREKNFANLVWTFLWYLLSITSTVYFGIFLLPLTLLAAFIEYLGAPMVTAKTLLKHIVIISIPALIILSLVLYPYIRLRQDYPGIKRSLADTAPLSAKPIDYLSVLPTSWLSDIGFPTNTNEHPLYPTMTLAILTLGAFIWHEKKNRKTIFLFGTLAFVAFILSLGPYLEIPKEGAQALQLRMPYYYVYKLFPLFQSVRVPARFSIFVILAMASCASFFLARAIKQPKHTVVGLLVVFLFLTEVWQTQIPFVKIPRLQELPPAYDLVKNAPPESIIVEIPFHPEWIGKRMEDQLMLTYPELTENDVYASEAYRTYFSAFHKKRMLNGYTGYFPNVYHDHSSVFDKFPTPDAIKTLEKRNVKYILIHAAQYANEPYSDIARKIREYPQLKLVAQFDTDYVYELDNSKN